MLIGGRRILQFHVILRILKEFMNKEFMKVKQKRQITIIQFMEILSAVGQRMPEEVMVAF